MLSALLTGPLTPTEFVNKFQISVKLTMALPAPVASMDMSLLMAHAFSRLRMMLFLLMLDAQNGIGTCSNVLSVPLTGTHILRMDVCLSLPSVRHMTTQTGPALHALRGMTYRRVFAKFQCLTRNHLMQAVLSGTGTTKSARDALPTGTLSMAPASLFPPIARLTIMPMDSACHASRDTLCQTGSASCRRATARPTTTLETALLAGTDTLSTKVTACPSAVSLTLLCTMPSAVRRSSNNSEPRVAFPNDRHRPDGLFIQYTSLLNPII